MSRPRNRAFQPLLHHSNPHIDRRQEFSGIMFLSVPQKDYVGRWTTENGRAVLTKTDKTNGSNWTLRVDGHEVGTGYPRLDEMVAANEWAIRKVL